MRVQRPSLLHGPSPGSRPAGGAETGQALVEFALVTPIQLFVILAIVQTAHILVSKQVVAYAAHAAARATLVGRDAHQAAAMICSAISPVKNGEGLSVPGWGALRRSAASLQDTRVRVIEDPGARTGEVRVAVEHRLFLIVPFASVLFADQADQDRFTLRLRHESVIHKPWTDTPSSGRGHPWIPDVPLEASRRWGT